MRAVYLDTFAGISGNMLLGALIDAGYPLTELNRQLQKLQLGEYELIDKKVNKLGIEAQYFNVLLPQEHEHASGGDAHTHGHEHEHEHHHGHDHARQHEHDKEHVHHHEHRNLHDIMTIIGNSELSESVKAQAEKVFLAIAQAEAKVHGKPVEEVHFHEVGAIDTIIDIVGCLLGLEYLGIEKIYVGVVTTGYGFVQCAHGLMPVPAPATAELLQGLPQRQGIVEREMTTPTGAALVKVLAEPVSQLPAGFSSEKIAYGAGSRDVQIPNVLRMYVGRLQQNTQQVVEAACNLDDVSGEVLGYTMQQLLQAGALDAWSEPIMMKKGRPACKLMFLAAAGQLDDLLQLVLAETGTLGVRYHYVDRKVLKRDFLRVETAYGPVRVKYARVDGKLSSMAPEYEDCRKLAEACQVPLRQIFAGALKAAGEMLHE